MAAQLDTPPFHLQPVLSEIYHAKDLLDLSAPGQYPCWALYAARSC